MMIVKVISYQYSEAFSRRVPRENIATAHSLASV
jgi:hypothetical protein